MGFGSRKKWTLDHSLDDLVEYNVDRKESMISTISGRSSRPSYADDPSTLLETEEEKKLRRRSHWVAYATMFVMTVGFSVVLSGVWPYLEQLEGEGTRSKTALGWVVAANPFGQMLASPIVGLIGNKLGSIRRVCYFTVTCFVIGNMLYSFLPNFENPYPWMIFSRFIVGISSSNVTLCRSYLASSTTLKERTKGIAIISAAQSLGFVVGPAIQTVLSLSVGEAYKYRSAGWVAALLGLINFVILTPYIFKEYNMGEKERALIKAAGNESGEDEMVLPKTDLVAVASILFGFFMNQFVYVLLETLMEPFVTDQYEWCHDIAVVVVGVSFVAAGLMAVCMFITATRLARRFDERKILICGAFIPIMIGMLCFQPFPGASELNYCPKNDTTTTLQTTTTLSPTTMHFLEQGYDETNYREQLLNRKYEMDRFPYFSRDTTISRSKRSAQKKKDEWCPHGDGICYGCDFDQEWCIGAPHLPIAQFYIAFFIVILAYPYGVSMSNAIFSKLLGPKPQGTWMGVLTASGSLARVTGPIFVSYVYTKKGTRWCFGILFVGMVLAFIELIIFYPRLVPMKVPTIKKKGKERV